MVSIIIVDYKTIEKTIKYIEHLADLLIDWNVYTPIVIDNSEDDVSFNWLKQRYKVETKELFIKDGLEMEAISWKATFGCFWYCHTLKNVGYALGNNIGASLSQQLVHDSYYLICNNDLRIVNSFDFNTIQEIFDLHDDIAIIGTQIVDSHGNNQSPRKKVSVFKKLFLSCWLSTWPFRKDIDIDYTGNSKYCYWVSGSFFFVRADYFHNAGMFDENTFLFAEEMILSERLWRINKKVYFYNDIKIIHEHGGSISSNSVLIKSERWSLNSIQYYSKCYRNTPNYIINLSNINFNIYQNLKNIRGKMKR